MLDKIIVINGASSSGTTCLVNRFCTLVSHRYHQAHIDDFLSELPLGMWECCCDSDDGWARIGKAFNEHLFELSTRHDRVIADSFYKLPPAINHLFSMFGRENVFFLQLFCELSELERREKARGDRRRGLARSQFDQIYAFRDYNLLIDSTFLSVEECTWRLIEQLPNQAYSPNEKSWDD